MIVFCQHHLHRIFFTCKLSCSIFSIYQVYSQAISELWLINDTKHSHCTSLSVFLSCVYEGMQQIGLTAGRKGRAQVQSVLLLTDGLANEGIKSKDGILGEMRKLQDSKKVREVGSKEEGKQCIISIKRSLIAWGKTSPYTFFSYVRKL